MMENKQAARSVVWARRDLPGHEACRILQLDASWQVDGVAVFVYEKVPCRLEYVIDCDLCWATRSTVVTGWIGSRKIDVTVVRGAAGGWQLNGWVCENTAGCFDIDLNFSPSTNLLPIRRLDPAVGASVRVRAAWLRFPSFVLEPLEQSYTRLDHGRYRYESAGGRFVADLTVDEIGLVIDYGEIWKREAGA